MAACWSACTCLPDRSWTVSCARAVVPSSTSRSTAARLAPAARAAAPASAGEGSTSGVGAGTMRTWRPEACRWPRSTSSAAAIAPGSTLTPVTGSRGAPSAAVKE